METDRLQRLIMWIAAVTLVVGTILALRFVRGYQPAAGFNYPTPGDMPANVALRFENVRVTGRKNNQPAWTLTAGKVETDRDHTTLNFSQQIAATLIDSGQPRAYITAPVATYESVARMIVAAGRIQCRVYPKSAAKNGVKSTATHSSSQDLVIDANEVVWNVGTQLVTCRGPVHATEPGGTVDGDELVVNLLTQDMSVQNMHGQVSLDDTDDNGLSGSLQGLTQGLTQ